MLLTKSLDPKLIKYDLKHVWIVIVGFTPSAFGAPLLVTPRCSTTANYGFSDRNNVFIKNL